ncbi:MAG: hypothetical protein ACD_18C00087G0002 [uncultured bacterium]|nr:MAG: hypothetical protein ACD_18C00087G0002 [uncultured bacterium]
MLEKSSFYSLSDYKKYNDKEEIITLLYSFLGKDYSRKDFMFWAQNVIE